MKNNIKLPDNVNPAPFLQSMEINLINNLSRYLINSLSNMLAIDYANRIKHKYEIDDYVEKCTTRLKKHLGHKIVMDEDFSSTMSLFTIAISEAKNLSDDSSRSQNQEQDVLIDGIISNYFSDLPKEEVARLKEVLKTLITSSESRDIMNFISSDPKLFYSIVFASYKEKVLEKERLEFISVHINKIIEEKKSINKSISNVKSLTSKIALSTGLFAAASIGALITGVALPILLIPATLASIKIAPTIGEKLGSAITKTTGIVKARETSLKGMINSILQTKISKSQAQEHYVGQEKSVVIQKSLQITKNLSSTRSIENAKNTKKERSR